MKILFTGKGSSGSWKIRGLQIANALGAQAFAKASFKLCSQADLIVAVKRLDPQLIDNINRSGRPWVWDLVDFYPQPTCTSWTREKAVSWVAKAVENLRVKPVGIIWPCAKMMDDCTPSLQSYEFRNRVIYHHHRPGLCAAPPRKKLSCLGYEGSPNYIVPFLPSIRAACERLNVEFVVNPERLTDCDALLALRCPSTNGYVQRNWKSNVKLANAHAVGVPFLAQRESAYLETASGRELWCPGPDEIYDRLLSIQDREVRCEIQRAFLKKAYPLQAAASEFKSFFSEVLWCR